MSKKIAHVVYKHLLKRHLKRKVNIVTHDKIKIQSLVAEGR